MTILSTLYVVEIMRLKGTSFQMIFHACSHAYNSTLLWIEALSTQMITWDLIQVFLHTSKGAQALLNSFWWFHILIAEFCVAVSLEIDIEGKKSRGSSNIIKVPH